MPRVPQSYNNTTPVEKFDNTAYDAVELVAQNIDAVIAAAGGVDVMSLYLGAYDTEPTQGHDGEPLVSGNFYLDTTSSSLKYWDAENSVWIESDVDAVVSAAQDAIAAKNAAEGAQEAAEAASNVAINEATNASSSASAASNSASNAATSAINANDSAQAASGSATSASQASTAAQNSENAASTFADESSASATNSENSATAAAASESNAASSAVSAANSASQAEAAFDNFDDMYLGRKTSEPTVDNDGNPLQVGASYWHDNGDDTGEQRFWNGATWESPELTATQAAQAAVVARDDAQISETNAQNSANAAGADANAAGNSATDAANSASAAAASESGAEGFKDEAETAQGIAQSAANAAGVSESNAATSETNALASENKAEQWAEEAEDTEVEPSKYSAKHWAAKAADSAGDVSWKVHTRGEAELNQMREQNKDARAASGYDHYGKSFNATDIINEGMCVPESHTATWANQIALGTYSNATARIGTSETDFPVSCIAGFISNIIGISRSDGFIMNSGSFVKFPDAPNGTVIYESTGNARGTGLRTLDFTVDVDPKYGDVATDTNEAVARAFEGRVLNGDFRRDVESWRAVQGAVLEVTNGVARITESSSSSDPYIGQNISVSEGEELELGFSFNNRSLSYAHMYVEIAYGGTASHFSYTATQLGYHKVRFTVPADTNDIADIRIRVGNTTSGWLETSGMSIRRLTEEVVIDRHDMFGGEFFLEEVSQTNPYVYPKGMIQSQVTAMNGITAVRSNRPDTYYAVYPGDTGSSGLGVDFWAATDQEKIDMVSDYSNNIFLLKDGRLCQWRMRQRTCPSVGNGGWKRDDQSIDPSIRSRYGLTAGRDSSAPQGYLDTVPAYGTAYWTPTNGTTSWQVDNPNNGVFKPSGGYGGAPFGGMFGECYFHVWGVVRRLNQGGYHPSHNTLGTRSFRATSLVGAYWHTLSPSARPKSTADCFRVGDNEGEVHPDSGDIDAGTSGAKSGRQDDRRFDAIYAGGDGGVNDYRLPSWDMSSKEEASKVFQKVVAGTYRGEEELAYMSSFVVNQTVSSASTGFILVPQAAVQGDTSWIPNGTGSSAAIACSGNAVIEGVSYKINRVYYNTTRTEYAFEVLQGLDTSVGDSVNIVFGYFNGSSVSGKFQMVDVFADPADILNIPELSNGWQGGWAGIPGSAPNGDVDFTRKNVGGTPTRTYWTGSGWSTGAMPNYDSKLNGSTRNWSSTAGYTYMFFYTAFAKQTKEADNAPVLNGSEGLGVVKQLGSYLTNFGSLFAESLMGKVITSSVTDSAITGELTVLELPFRAHQGMVGTGSSRPLKHSPISLEAVNNESPAVKAMWYQTANHQQVSLNFAWNEMVYTPFSHSDVVVITPSSAFSAQAGDVGKLNGFDNPAFDHLYVRFSSATSGTWSAATFVNYGIYDNRIKNMAAGGTETTSYQPFGGVLDGWGDESMLRVTGNTSTYTNLNDETCLSGTATLSKPIGYTKNQARVGEQDEGVDL